MGLTLALCADIGGTNARFALVDPVSFHIAWRLTLPTKNYSDAKDLLQDVLNSIKESNLSFDGVSLSIAGPEQADSIKMTHSNILFAKSDIRAITNQESVILINDFAALGYSVNIVSQIDTLHAADSQGSKLLLGPGTGLGKALLLERNNLLIPIPSEGGHKAFSPRNQEQIHLLKFAMRERDLVQVEDLLSGRGIELIYRFVRQERFSSAQHSLHSEAISSSTDECSIATMDLFTQLLAEEAQNSTLEFASFGGVYLAGSIAQSLSDNQKICFVKHFSTHTKFHDILNKISLHLITASDAGVLGAAYRLQMENIK